MNLYELSIELVKGSSMETTHPIVYHINSEEYDILNHLIKIGKDGFIKEDDYAKRYIPGHRINFIEIKILEKIQEPN